MLLVLNSANTKTQLNVLHSDSDSPTHCSHSSSEEQRGRAAPAPPRVQSLLHQRKGEHRLAPKLGCCSNAGNITTLTASIWESNFALCFFARWESYSFYFLNCLVYGARVVQPASPPVQTHLPKNNLGVTISACRSEPPALAV